MTKTKKTEPSTKVRTTEKSQCEDKKIEKKFKNVKNSKLVIETNKNKS